MRCSSCVCRGSPRGVLCGIVRGGDWALALVCASFGISASVGKVPEVLVYVFGMLRTKKLFYLRASLILRLLAAAARLRLRTFFFASLFLILMA
jgi:hypothetical protein